MATTTASPTPAGRWRIGRPSSLTCSSPAVPVAPVPVVVTRRIAPAVLPGRRRRRRRGRSHRVSDVLTRFDEYPIHPLPQPIARPGTTDRNAYDRYWMSASHRDGAFQVEIAFG